VRELGPIRSCRAEVPFVVRTVVGVWAIFDNSKLAKFEELHVAVTALGLTTTPDMTTFELTL
jgi:hypothetical protein